MENSDWLIPQLTEELCSDILDFWSENMVDTINGGFYGRMTGWGEIKPDAPKGAVMYGRILWTFSAAYRVLGRRRDMEMAARAKDYILEHFYDDLHGGIYWSLDARGNPLDTKKQFYALGFIIYGLSEYNRATGDEQALEYAITLYKAIESHSFDRERNGYIEAATRNWMQIDDLRLSDKDANERKTMNTHLHILEAYTNLYRVWKDDGLRGQLVNLLNLFLDKIESSPTHHLGLFFDDNWVEKSVGTYSYGHDIEASWLLLEAAFQIGDHALTAQVKKHCARIAFASLEGYQSDGSMIYECHADGSLNKERHWWVQAETVVGLFYLYRFHGDRQALRQALKTWEYIKKHLIDHVCGEWVWSVRENGTVNRDDDKAGFWKCPYHNGRMCLELIALLQDYQPIK